MPTKHHRQTDDLHFRVLKLLQDRPDITQRDLADQLGISRGKANYCLKALVDRGWVKLQNFTQSSHRWGYAYMLTPAGISEKAVLTGQFLQRKMAEYEALKKEIEALSNDLPACAAGDCTALCASVNAALNPSEESRAL
ncbi:MAG: MarR family EPS-associated transcriptional regulator [Limnohabitans sp.]